MDDIVDIISLSRSLIRTYTEDEKGPLPVRSVAQICINSCLSLGSNPYKKPRVLVLSGLRGVGKTTILFQIMKALLQSGMDEEDVIFFSMDRASFSGANIRDIVGDFEKKVIGGHLSTLERPVFFFIDEAHYSGSWALQIKTLSDEAPKAIFIVTGSSALSMDISPDLARRASLINVPPLNYLEYLQIRNRSPPAGDPGPVSLNAILSSEDARSAYVAYERYSNWIGPLLRGSGGYSPGALQNHILKGGFPFSIMMEDPYPRLYDTVRRIIEKDVPLAGEHETGTLREIPRLLGMIAPSPEISVNTISRDIEGLSVRSVRDVLDTLGRSGLIFEVGAVGGIKKTIRSDTRKYFASASLSSAILRAMGRDPMGYIGSLSETAVAALLRERISPFSSMRYIKEKGTCDLIVMGPSGNVCIEVGSGNKKDGVSQLYRTMRDVPCSFGILVDDSRTPSLKGNILRIPLMEFLSM